MDAIQHVHLDKIKNAIPPADLKELFDIISQASKMRLECAQRSARLAYRFRLALSKHAEKFGLTYEEIIYLTTDEIKALDKKEMKKIKKIIKERQTGYGISKVNGIIEITVGNELEKQKEYFGLTKSHGDVSEIKGNIGCKGIVRGVVAIVLVPTDNDKVKKGMILVAPETTPDFVPAMGRAAAFVTDRGGVTSHAAIIAREMNKPCIIGTDIGTQVLKDGDMVEVDADKGIVKIIK